MAAIAQHLRRVGPYVALELVMPGGTLLAILLFLHRSGRLRDFAALRTAARAASRALNRAGSKTFDQFAYVWQPASLR